MEPSHSFQWAAKASKGPGSDLNKVKSSKIVNPIQHTFYHVYHDSLKHFPQKLTAAVRGWRGRSCKRTEDKAEGTRLRDKEFRDVCFNLGKTGAGGKFCQKESPTVCRSETVRVGADAGCADELGPGPESRPRPCSCALKAATVPITPRMWPASHRTLGYGPLPMMKHGVRSLNSKPPSTRMKQSGSALYSSPVLLEKENFLAECKRQQNERQTNTRNGKWLTSSE